MLQRLGSVIWKYKLILVGAIAAASIWGWQVAQQRSATLMAFETNTGKVQWFQPLRSVDDFYSRGAIAANGTVVLSSAESSTPEQKFDTYQLQAFVAQSGDRLWAKSFRAPIGDGTSGFGYLFAANPAIDLQPTALYAQIGNELQSLDPRTGQPRWAIERPWFNINGRDVWYGLGTAAVDQQLSVLQFNQRQRLLQTLDAATGKLLRQTTIRLSDLTTTRDRITQSNQRVFLETSGLIPLGNNSFRDSGQSTVIAYDLDSGQVRFRAPIRGSINNLQAVGKTLQLSTEFIPDSYHLERQVLALDSQTGRVLWRRSHAQLQCFDFSYSWRVDAQSVYLNCNRRRNNQDSSTIMVLSAETGQIQWQSLISPNRHSRDLPSAISARQLLTFRQVRQGDREQTQAIAIDRQTGKLLWTVALFDDRYVNAFRSIVATGRDSASTDLSVQFFVLDAIPQWQLWLLQLNRHWYLKQPISIETVNN